MHLDVGYKFHGLAGSVDGVHGQTYRPAYVNKLDNRHRRQDVYV
jgi:hypothetical protein